MAVKRFLVNGENVTGKHRATRGQDSIKVKGQSNYHIYAYIGEQNMCESLIGHSHIRLDTDHPILGTADLGEYSIGVDPASPGGETANGTLHVGSHGDGDGDEDDHDGDGDG